MILKKDNNAIISQDFKILSVSATNLREIEVEFSQPVELSSLKDAFVSNKGVGRLSVSALDLENVAILTCENPLANLRDYKLVLNNVKSKLGGEIRNQEIEFKATDQDYPEIKDIKITGPRNFEIHFE